MKRKRIFFTLGTSTYSFPRFATLVQRYCDKPEVTAIYQFGNSDACTSANCTNYKYLDNALYLDALQSVDVVIAHCGIGTTIDAARAGKPIIMVPRMKKFNEHVDDHQIELAEMLSQKYEIPYVLDNECIDLEDARHISQATNNYLKFSENLRVKYYE